MEATIRVLLHEKIGEISPFLYGGGFEPHGGAVTCGLDAQMLEGGSFEEEDVNQDGISDKWLPAGYGKNQVRYSRDGRYAVKGRYSQKVEIVAYDDGERGIKQRGIHLREGKKYRASMYLRQEGVGREGKVTVCLRKGKEIYAQQRVEGTSSEWKKYTLVLSSCGATSNAEFCITLAGKGSVWIDDVSLVPEETYRGHGTRIDIIEAVLELHPTFIRWPGGWFSETYHWQDGIGDVDGRPVTRKYYSTVRAKSNPSWELNRFGTDEFLQFCQDIEAVPLLTVNIGYAEGAEVREYLEEATSWVEYCNGDVTTVYGALRAAHGHPEPYNVVYWEVGNEPWEMAPEAYAERFVQFARVMKEKDPTIKLIAAGGYGYNQSWNQRVLEVGHRYIDYLDLHYYYSDCDYFRAMAEPLHYEEFLENLKGTISRVTTERNIKASILEWNANTTWKDGTKLREGLFTAGFFNVLERQSDLVEQSSLWPLLRRVQPPGNHFSDHGLVWYDNHRVCLSPTALAFQLYCQHYAPELVRCTVDCATFDTGRRRRVPYLDAVATRDRERNTLILKVVNKHPEENMRARVALEGLSAGRLAAETPVSTLTGPTIDARNSLDRPHEVQIVRSICREASESFVYAFPAHSVTAFRFRVS
jgi:alpha-N-arabinofuranosidase